MNIISSNEYIYIHIYIERERDVIYPVSSAYRYDITYAHRPGQVGKCVDASRWCVHGWMHAYICHLLRYAQSRDTGQYLEFRMATRTNRGPSVQTYKHCRMLYLPFKSNWCVISNYLFWFLTNPNLQRKTEADEQQSNKNSVASATIPQLGPFWTAGNLDTIHPLWERYLYPCPSLPLM